MLVGGKALGGPLVGVCDDCCEDGPAPEVGRGKAPIPVNDTGCRSVRSPSTGEGDRVESEIPSPCD